MEKWMNFHLFPKQILITLWTNPDVTSRKIIQTLTLRQPPKKLAESSKINKKHLFLKKCKFHPKREAAAGFILWNKSWYIDSKIYFPHIWQCQNFTKNNFWLPSHKWLRFQQCYLQYYQKKYNCRGIHQFVFSSILCLNKINTSTTLEDIEESFVYRDILIKHLNTIEEWISC